MHKLKELKYKVQDQEFVLAGENSKSAQAISTISWGLLACSVLMLAGVWYYSHKYMVAEIKVEDIPLVHKSNKVLRSKPLDPGGVIFSNQDKEIYRNLGPGKQPTEKVDALESQEHAMQSSEIMRIITDLDAPPTTQQTEAASAEIAQPQDNATATSTPTIPHKEATTVKPAVQGVTEQGGKESSQLNAKERTHSIFAPITPDKKIDGTSKQKGNMIKASQNKAKLTLAVAATEQAVEQEWRRLKAQHKPLLNNVQYAIVRERAVNGKTVAKLVVTASNKQAAHALCEQIGINKQQCIVSD